MDSVGSQGRILAFERRNRSVIPEELVTQFQENFDNEFDVQRLRETLETRDIGKIAIATLRSFVGDEVTLSAERAVYRQTIFTPRCKADKDNYSEIADYVLRAPDEEDPRQDLSVAIQISPRALQVLHKPLSIIYEESDISITEQVALAYKAVFSGVVAQAVMKIAMRSDVTGFDERYVDKIDALYTQTFGASAEDITDHASRLNRIAMGVGGAVMLRQAAKSVEGDTVGRAGQSDVTQRLRFFALGLATSERRVVDQQQVSYALAHAYTPQETARVLKYWFA